MIKRKELIGDSDRVHYDFIGKITTAGRDGVGLEFHWDGSKLGIKREDEENYTYSDLAYLESLTTEHIENALGYTPADDTELVELKLIVDGHTISIDSIEIEIEKILKNINNLDELIDLKADLEYVDKIFNKLDKELTVEITDLKRHLEELKSKVNKISTKLDKYIEKFTNNMELKADITYVDDLINDVQELLSEHNLRLDVIDGEISIIKETVDKKADKTYVDEQLNAKYDKSETYTKEEVDERIANIIGNAPENLDTLEKLAQALDNDESFASTITKELSNKVDKEKGKGLSANDFNNMYKLKLDGIEYGANKITKVGQLENDIGYITLEEVPEVDLTDIENSISKLEELIETKANKKDIDEEISKIYEKINNLDIPDEVDLNPIYEKLDELQYNKSDIGHKHTANDISYNDEQLNTIIDDIRNELESLDIPEDVDLRPLYKRLENVENNKADKTYVDDNITMIINTIEELKNIKANKSEIPTKISQLDNDIEFITIDDLPDIDFSEIESDIIELQKMVNLKVEQDEFDAEIKNLYDKIDNMDIPEEIDLTPVYDKIEKLESQKANIDDVPTKTSQLENDSNYITEDDIPNVDDKVNKNGDTMTGALTVEGKQFTTELDGENIKIINHTPDDVGWSRRLGAFVDEHNKTLMGMGAYGKGKDLDYMYMGRAWDDTALRLYNKTNNAYFEGKVLSKGRDILDELDKLDNEKANKSDIPKVFHNAPMNAVTEDMIPSDFDYGVTICNQGQVNTFPSINDYGVSITIRGVHASYAQIFITRFGDMWSRRSGVINEWNGEWYNSKREINKKADKKDIGELKDLETLYKDNLVGAINESLKKSGLDSVYYAGFEPPKDTDIFWIDLNEDGEIDNSINELKDMIINVENSKVDKSVGVTSDTSRQIYVSVEPPRNVKEGAIWLKI